MAVKLGNGNWAVKEDKLLAYNDNSGLFFNKEFDFSRGSTATYVGRDGLIASAASDTPRIDFTNDTKGHLLLEPSRTNSITYSEDFSQWIPTNVTVTANQVLAPDGTLTADKIDFSASTSSRLAKIINLSSGTYTFSVYLRSVSGSGNFRLALAKQGGVVSTKTIYLTEEWQRFELEYTYDGLTNLIAYVGYYIDNTYLQEVYAWGAQIEAGSYATSYIPTTGAASTRNADVCNNSGSAQDFNSEEGVLYAEYKMVNQVASFPQIRIADSSLQNQVSFYTYNNTLQYYVKSNNINVILGSISVSENTDYKFAISYSSSETSIFLNGVKQGSYLNKDMPSNLEKLDIVTSDNVSKYKTVAVFTEALTDEQLEKLTS
jgi:hypothetical protein